MHGKRSSLPRLTLLVLAMTTGNPALSGLAHAQSGQPATPVGVDMVIEEPLHQTVPVLGRLVATRSGIVAARTGGPIGEFKPRVGDRVQEGDIIATLVRDALEAKRQLWLAEVAQAGAAVQTSKAEMTLNQQELDRLQDLEGSSAFSPARLDDSRQRVAVSRSALAESTAALSVAQANLRLAEIDLYNSDIRAPYDGVISRRHTEVGSVVTTGSPVASLIDDTTLEIEADVPAERVGGLTPGASVPFIWESGVESTAFVRAVVPDENPLTRTRSVRFSAHLDNDSVLAVNQSVTLRIPSAAPRSVTSVHKDAILNTGGRTIVYLAVNGKATPRPVVLGESIGSRFEVINGLTPGDIVVIRGNERLRPDQAILVSGQES